jgi:AcrR family transcriptional regulator
METRCSVPGKLNALHQGYREAVKQNIIHSTRKLFNRHGFEGVSLKQIMAGAGLTHIV